MSVTWAPKPQGAPSKKKSPVRGRPNARNRNKSDRKNENDATISLVFLALGFGGSNSMERIEEEDKK